MDFRPQDPSPGAVLFADVRGAIRRLIGGGRGRLRWPTLNLHSARNTSSIQRGTAHNRAASSKSDGPSVRTSWSEVAQRSWTPSRARWPIQKAVAGGGSGLKLRIGVNLGDNHPSRATTSTATCVNVSAGRRAGAVGGARGRLRLVRSARGYPRPASTPEFTRRRTVEVQRTSLARVKVWHWRPADLGIPSEVNEAPCPPRARP